MTARRAAFTQAEIKRAISAAETLGKTVAGIDFGIPGVGFRLLFGEPATLTVPGAAGPNEWDVVLPQ